jgi:hypothetical protein
MQENGILSETKINKYYTEAHKEAQQRYRDKNRELYNKSQRELYAKLRQDKEWIAKFNERSAKNNISYRKNKKEKILAENPNFVFRGRGRPRKIISTVIQDKEI